MMRIAIIGSGISGLTAAYLLSRKHEVVVYESDKRIGGHTATMNVEFDGKNYDIDTGFIVFNDWTYPNFKRLLAQLEVPDQPTDMGFSVSCQQSGLEYSGSSLNTVFAQRRNLINPNHWLMIRDILRFNRQAPKDVESKGKYSDITLGEYLQVNKYSKVFVEKYLVPMGAAIWSSSTSVIKHFPLQFFVKFFINHGLLSIYNRPQWHVIKGGSHSYLKPLCKPFANNIRLNTQVSSVIRKQKIEITTNQGAVDHFDHVVIACHSDQALSMLSDASEEERQVLGNIGYKNNEVVLHTDESLLPNSRSTWSSWNYCITAQDNDDLPPVLTYNMNILQNIQAPCTFCVTLNNTKIIDPNKIVGVYNYSHPVFSLEAIAAQQQWPSINGNNTWFCGAYWANGFHEDGVNSALRVAEQFGITL